MVLVQGLREARNIFSFCMCPGGQVWSPFIHPLSPRHTAEAGTLFVDLRVQKFATICIESDSFLSDFFARGAVNGVGIGAINCIGKSDFQ